jgi:aromatic-L-amino-acid/L-tryptophan decarboxylase
MFEQWMSWKRYGLREIGRWVDANCDHAEHLFQRCAGSKDFVPAVRPPMSAICLRWVGGGAPSPERQAALHREVARRVQDGGRFWISTTVLKGQAHFRINPVNFRTRAAHMDALLEELRATCQAVARDGGGGPPGPVEA